MLEQRKLRGIKVLVSPRLESDGYLVAFTERTGGTSDGPYRSLNLGLRTKDRSDRVNENRRRVCDALGMTRFSSARQVHGAKLARVGPKRSGAGFSDPDTAMPNADGLVTASKGIALAILTADCVPVALVSPAEQVLAVVHAGWRGVAAGVIANSLQAFDDPARVRAVLGPAIGPDHYEVGEDVALAVSAASQSGAVTTRRGKGLFLDLPATVTAILRELGVPARSIERADECTACDRRRFYSHRREGETGRQALIGVRL